MMKPTFEVDKVGLSKILARRGVGFAVAELIQNAWDQNVTRVEVKVNPEPGRPYGWIEVTDDDPNGFADLSHAYTLFAESSKKGDPEKRGRFNLGEKLVIAVCSHATITTTTGKVTFNKFGRRHSPTKTEAGSVFRGFMRMTRDELAEAEALIRSLIPPVPTFLNGSEIEARVPVAEFEASLTTEVADAEGFLRRSKRKTTVRLYEPLEGETASVYEMGIPVIETGDRWHVDVCQKVPLTLERDGLPAAYLRDLRALTMNAAASLLTEADATAKWIDDAIEDDLISGDALKRALDLRYGEKRVTFDPSDREANARAVAEGYTVIQPGSLSKDAWDRVRAHQASIPAGRVTPTPKPFSEDGRELHVIEEKDWTVDQKRVARLAKAIFNHVFGGADLTVVYTNDWGWNFAGAFGGSVLTVSTVKNPKSFFDWPDGRFPPSALIDFLTHEFGHRVSGNHLSREYYDALTMIAGRIVILALEDPKLFRK